MLSLCQAFLRLPAAWLGKICCCCILAKTKMSLSFLHKFQFVILKLEFTTDMEPDNN